MRKMIVMAAAVLVSAAFISAVYADQAVDAAYAKFKEDRKAYIAAKEEFSDAQIDALRTIGKAEKATAVERVKKARAALKAAKASYKQALASLHSAECSKDAKIDRSPWN